jgi:hypothetical protein
MVSNAPALTWGGHIGHFIGESQDTYSPMTVESINSYPMVTRFESDNTAATDQIVGVGVLRVLPESGYRLSRPFPLTVYRARDYYWVAPDAFVLHGIGDTPDDAIEDYAYALLDYYEDLRDQRNNLAPHLVEHLDFLEGIIVEV